MENNFKSSLENLKNGLKEYPYLYFTVVAIPIILFLEIYNSIQFNIMGLAISLSITVFFFMNKGKTKFKKLTFVLNALLVFGCLIKMVSTL